MLSCLPFKDPAAALVWQDWSGSRNKHNCAFLHHIIILLHIYDIYIRNIKAKYCQVLTGSSLSNNNHWQQPWKPSLPFSSSASYKSLLRWDLIRNFLKYMTVILEFNALGSTVQYLFLTTLSYLLNIEFTLCSFHSVSVQEEQENIASEGNLLLQR